MAGVTNLFDYSVEILYQKYILSRFLVFFKEIREWAFVYICLVLLLI